MDLSVILTTQLSCWYVLAAQAEGEAVGGSSIFSGTFADALWTVIAFVVLLIVLTKLAWRPLQETLRARQRRIEQQLQQAEASRQRAEQMLDDYEQQGHAIIKQATEQAQQYQHQAAEKTREELLAIRQRSQQEIESAYAVALEQLWQQTGQVLQQLGSDVLGRAMTDQDNQRLIDQAVERIRQTGGSR